MGQWLYDEDNIDRWKDVFKLETNVYLCNSNSIGLYYKNFIKNKNGFISYADYRDFCKDNGYKPYSRQRYDEIFEWIKANYADEEMLINAPKLAIPF